ncbi:hypothetical protein [Saccharomonospora xinjiangensis]|uniref:Uncharacterized protein n=1 Tax=Saccharomonospora xinjiangensis XJ-54 TaxID=882086 RepID=I0V5Q5_9PSEU|nr:hypothetical protein [Saccharomonospora xinjiangensis]EID55458.1 hypothetical protein SacxiDRAFT_3252 [Saccharomonospora xinjiangensis XJ-54]
MEHHTEAVLMSLTSLRADLDRFVADLREGSVPVARQRALAARLIEVGDLLDEHADQQAAGRNGHGGLTLEDLDDR